MNTAETLDTGTKLDPYLFSMFHDGSGYTVELEGKTAHGQTLDEAAKKVLIATGHMKEPERPHFRSEGLVGIHQERFFQIGRAVSASRANKLSRRA